MSIEELSKLYGDYHNLHQRRFEDTAAVLSRHHDPEKGNKLLDVGIFPGIMATMARDMGYDIHGIANEEMTPEFRDYAKRHNFTLFKLDVETDPFPFDDNTYDVILCTEVIEHMYRNPFSLIEKCFRALRPGGLLILSTPNLTRQPVIRGLINGQTYMPPMDGPLDESFPVNPCYTHRREYTMDEIAYMCCRQDKFLFRFRETERFFSPCWDKGLRESISGIRRPMAACKCLANWLNVKYRPERRSCLMFAAHKPDLCTYVGADRRINPSGFHELEHDSDTDSMSRRPLPTPFRWSKPNASFSIPIPHNVAEGALSLLLPVGFVVPEAIPAQRVRITLGKSGVTELLLNPGKGYEIASMSVPQDCLDQKQIDLKIDSSAWRPSAFGFTDDRELGIMVSWGETLLIS